MMTSGRHNTHTASPRALLVISAQPPETLAEAVAAGREPRRDYQALQAELNADLLCPADARRTRFGRLLARAAGIRPALAWAAFRRRHAYDVIYTDGENVGLPFALLLKLRGLRPGSPRHVMLTHYLSTRPKRVLFRLGAGSHIDTLIVHSSAQRQLAIRDLHMPAERIALLPYFADVAFWGPSASSDDSRERAEREPPLICAVGLEFRDYNTLARAARGLEAEIRIAAASHWSHHSAFARSGRSLSALPSRFARPPLEARSGRSLPSNISVQSYSYLPLRDLYAAARFVVVPLKEVDNQAGITVVLEAMAMGKAVIISATRGQTDVVRDRRNGGRGRVAREWWPGFVDAPEVAATLSQLPTGFYVTPGDPDELRHAMRYLLDHPDLASELGRNGRRVAEALFTLDAFAARFAAVIRGETSRLLTPLVVE